MNFLISHITRKPPLKASHPWFCQISYEEQIYLNGPAKSYFNSAHAYCAMHCYANLLKNPASCNYLIYCISELIMVKIN